jgi:hypothetical protein
VKRQSIGGTANPTKIHRIPNDPSVRTALLHSIKAGIQLLELEQKTPKTYQEAVSGPDADKWIAAMKKEIGSCEINNTWLEVPRIQLRKGTNIIKCKWVFKIKVDENGEVTEYKARLTPKGFMQKEGVDYFEVFAATGQYKTMRLGLSLTASWDHELDQMDVPSAFLKADLEEEVYMEMPEGFRKADKVLLLKKALYGLKQAPREWYLLIRKFITEELKFKATISDPCLFFRRSKTGKVILIFLFVDDFQISYHKDDAAEWSIEKEKLIRKFNTKDMGASKWILGMRIQRDRRNHILTLDHELYITKALQRFGLSECKTVSTPETIVRRSSSEEAMQRDGRDQPCDKQTYMELVGTLMYPSISTRPDISNAARSLAQHMQDPKRRHEIAAKRVLRYLAGTKEIGLMFGREEKRADSEMKITAFGDADWGNNRFDRKSITGWIVKLNGDVVSWASKKQHTVAQSTCEAELYAEGAAINEVLWQRGLLKELGLRQAACSVVYCDNQPAISISKNGIKSDRTKHVDIKYHFITEQINKGTIESKYMQTDKQQADMLTKALDKQKFESFRSQLMMC